MWKSGSVEHESVVGSPSPRGAHTFRARERVAVAQDRALRRTGRARGEHEHRRVVRSARVEHGDPPWWGGRRVKEGSSDPRPSTRGVVEHRGFGRASCHTLPSSLGPNAVLTGTTIAPSRQAATCASTRSAEGGQPDHDAVAGLDAHSGEAGGSGGVLC